MVVNCLTRLNRNRSEGYQGERMTPKQFALTIEKRASKKRLTHMEAVLDYCTEKEIEPDQITHLINRALKDKIKMNAQDLNFLPKTATLPV
tara:strand:- start:1758 stop:2030 length:273 start_codon:yes stop_codon:yes gene_type:complete